MKSSVEITAIASNSFKPLFVLRFCMRIFTISRNKLGDSSIDKHRVCVVIKVESTI